MLQNYLLIIYGFCTYNFILVIRILTKIITLISYACTLHKMKML